MHMMYFTLGDTFIMLANSISDHLYLSSQYVETQKTVKYTHTANHIKNVYNQIMCFTKQ